MKAGILAPVSYDDALPCAHDRGGTHRVVPESVSSCKERHTTLMAARTVTPWSLKYLPHATKWQADEMCGQGTLAT